MPRKSRAALDVEAFLASQSVPQLVHKAPNPPSPPTDLPSEQQAMWKEINAEFVLGPTAQFMLKSGLRMHAAGRKLRKQIEEDGVVIANRDGNPRPNPLLPIEQRYYRAYLETLKALKLRF